LYGLVGLILLTLWGLIIGFSALQKQRLIDDAQRELGYLRSAIAQHTESLFRSAETDLRVIDLWLQDRPGVDPLRDPGFNSLVDEIRKASAGLIDPRMVSTRGQLYYLPARDGRPLADVSDRPYYREALKLDAGQLFIGDPVLSRVTGKWGIPVSMRLTKPVGGMQVVFAAIELDRLQAFHEQFRVKPSGAVAVLRRDGVFMSRTPFQDGLIGRDFSDQPWFALMLQEAHGATITEGTLTNNPPRLQNFEQLKGYPLIVSVSRNVDDVLANYYERRGIILVVVAVITVLVLFFSWRLYRAQHELHQTAAMLMAAGDASPLGQFRTDAQDRLVAVNEAWRRIHGIRQDMLPQDWTAVTRLESEPAASMVPQGYLPQGEHPLRTADGRPMLLKIRRADIVVDGVVLGCSGTVEDITEPRANQKAQRMLTEIFELSTDLVAQSDMDGNCLYANPAFRRFVGCAPDAPPASLSVPEILGPEQFARRGREAMPTALKQGYWQGETMVRNTLHEERILSHLVIAHRSPDGSAHHFSSILRDITAQKMAERQLRESERRLRAITDSVPALIAEIGTDYVYHFANRTYEEWLGIPRGDILGRTVEQVLGRQLFAVIGPYHERAFKGERVDYVREARHADASRWLHITLVPRLDEGGQPDGCYAIGFDITENRKVEAALRQSERLLTSITDRMPMRVSYVDHEQRYRFVNQAYERAFARPRQVWYGRTVREMLGEAAYLKAEPHIVRALQGEAVSFDGESITAEGYRSYRSDYVPQFAEDARGVIGFVCIVTDTTGQKLEERRLIALSQRDPLTGLLNRAGLEVRLREALQHAQQSQSFLAVMYLDVDRFKQINDSLGHLVGDLLLQGFGGRLAKALRANDTVARLGGDEFVILLEDVDSPSSAARMAKNIVDGMQAPFILEDQAVQVTTSVGVAIHQGSAAATAKDLMRRADEQLYQAKGAGRNRYCMEEGGAA
jgi:diguanylate cyclase (GGDEF)-like protein/PAS domain S-box-containing protein